MASFAKLHLEGISSSGSQKIARQHVRGKLVVYPHNGDPVWSKRKTSARVFSWDKDATEGTVLSLNAIKTMGAPSGTWQAVVKVAHDSDLNLSRGDVQDGDWVDVSYMRNGIEFPVMRGVVDSVRERRTSAGGATVRIFTLSGRDHGAPFETPITWQSIWVQSLGQLVRGIMTDKVKGKIGGSPDEMFEILIQAAFERGSTGNKSSWQLPDSLIKVSTGDLDYPYFYTALSVTTEATRGAYYNEIQAWTQVGQTLHQTLQQWCNPLLNEIYYDLEYALRKIGQEGKRPEMTARLRERPFCNTTDGIDSPWFSLDTLTIPSWLIEDYDAGRSGAERYNLIELLADFGFINPQESAAFAAPIWDRFGIQTHGLRPWQQNVRYVAKEGEGQAAWLSERKVWQKLVVDWYAANPYFLSGSMGVGILLPEAKIGTRLVYDTAAQESREQYYIEGVEHKYSFSQAGHSGRTSLTVTRGGRGTDRDYLDMVKNSASLYSEVF